jgi:hypothetical protein
MSVQRDRTGSGSRVFGTGALLACALVAVLLVAGCAGSKPSPLVGKWAAVSEQGKTKAVYVFNQDGTMETLVGGTNTRPGAHWTLSGDTLTMKVIEGGKTKDLVYQATIANNSLTLADLSAAGGQSVTLFRQTGK